jgi:hypothetical protein
VLSPSDDNLDVLRGGLPPVTLSWYEHRDASGIPQPFKIFRNTDFCQGFNLTINEHTAITNRIIALFSINDIYKLKWSTQAARIARWPIYQILENEFDCFIDPAVPGWWANQALDGWMKKTVEWMCSSPDQIAKPRKRKYSKKVPGEDSFEDRPPLKFCFFEVRARDDLDKKRPTTVSLIDLIRVGGKTGGPTAEVEDLEINDLDAKKLFARLTEQMEFDPLDRLVYSTAGGKGETIEVEINDDASLKIAALCLRALEGYSMALEVVPTPVLPEAVMTEKPKRKRAVKPPGAPKRKYTKRAKLQPSVEDRLALDRVPPEEVQSSNLALAEKAKLPEEMEVPAPEKPKRKYVKRAKAQLKPEEIGVPAVAGPSTLEQGRKDSQMSRGSGDNQIDK